MFNKSLEKVHNLYLLIDRWIDRQNYRYLFPVVVCPLQLDGANEKVWADVAGFQEGNVEFTELGANHHIPFPSLPSLLRYSELGIYNHKPFPSLPSLQNILNQEYTITNLFPPSPPSWNILNQEYTTTKLFPPSPPSFIVFSKQITA